MDYSCGMSSKLDGLSLHDLRVVVVLSEVLHFGKAAEICGVAQPSLSASVKKVEHSVGETLFARTSRRCSLTEAGLAFVEAARLSLAAVDGFAGGQSGARTRFRMGMIPTVGPFFVQEVLPRVLAGRGDWEASIVEATTGDLEAMVLGREVDAAVVSLPISGPAFRLQTLYQERLLLAVEGGHEWVGRGRVKVGDLQPERLLVLEHGHCLRAQTLEACGSSPLTDRPGHALGLATLMGMVSAGAGYTVLPETAEVWASLGARVALVPFDDPEPTRTVVLMSLESRREELRVLEEAVVLGCGEALVTRRGEGA